VRARWIATLLISLLSIFLALVLPMGRGESVPLDSAPGLIYLLIYVTRMVSTRRQQRLLAEEANAEQLQ